MKNFEILCKSPLDYKKIKSYSEFINLYTTRSFNLKLFSTKKIIIIGKLTKIAKKIKKMCIIKIKQQI